MKVLVADKFEKSGLDGLQDIGCEVVYNPDLKEDSLVKAVRDSGADVLVVGDSLGVGTTPHLRAQLDGVRVDGDSRIGRPSPEGVRVLATPGGMGNHVPECGVMLTNSAEIFVHSALWVVVLLQY